MKCLYCNKEFEPSKNDKRIKYCSKKCRLEHRRESDYMRNYYSNNTDRWKERQSNIDYKDKKNKARRQRYAKDVEYRNNIKKQVKKYNKDNPETKIKQRLKTYNITIEDYKNLLKKQKHKCAICGATDGDILGNRLYVDHDHKTNKVRGLLCSKCNFALGQFNDDISLMKKAIRYLEENYEKNDNMV